MSWIGKGDDAPEPDEETRAKRSRGSGSGARLRIVLRCTFCHDALTQREAVYCALCLAPHHHDCQRTHGRCAAPGCVCPATIRARATSTRQQAVRPRIPSGPRAALVNLPVLLGIVAGTAGLAGSLTAVSLTLRRSHTRVVLEPAPPPSGPSGLPADSTPWEQPRAVVRVEANGFVQPVPLARGDRLLVAPRGDATVVWVLRDGRERESVLSLLPAGAIRLGLDEDDRESDARVEGEETAAFEVLWWPAELDGPDAPSEPRPRLFRRTPTPIDLSR